MIRKPLPTPELLRKLLRYDPNTGKLFWRERTPDTFKGGIQLALHTCARWNGKFSGRCALVRLNYDGYRCGTMLGLGVRAHRVIWAMQTGEWPKDQVDHINHDRSDNRWSNLQEATNTENGRNKSMQANNVSGVMGVHWDRQSGKWRSTIKVNGRSIHLGLFARKAVAVSARKSAEIKHEFHVNHGT